ncbi:hypothetical protein L1887_08281 [Cichorium endivia]|nr:hypothetical protein L1887_08281 [Cichorium endivia]
MAILVPPALAANSNFNWNVIVNDSSAFFPRKEEKRGGRSFRARVHNETNIDASFAKLRQSNCPLPAGSGDNNLAPLEFKMPNNFDNNYYKNLITRSSPARLAAAQQWLH